MAFNKLILASAALLVPSFAVAQPVAGVYVSLSGGANWINNTHESVATAENFAALPGVKFDLINVGNITHDAGFGVLGSVGYGFSNSLRTELEVGFRQTRPVRMIPSATTPGGSTYSGSERNISIMANVLYDFNEFAARVNSPVVPYVGVGFGISMVDMTNAARSIALLNFGPLGSGSTYETFASSAPAFAFQGMVGFSYNVPTVPGLALTADFRMMALPSGYKAPGQLNINFVPGSLVRTASSRSDHTYSNELNGSAMIGLRYAFGAAAPAAPAAVVAPAPAPAPIPAVQPARSYLVFFDWDKADLTARARQIIADAAQASTKIPTTRIEVAGHADTTGTAGYNQGLSMKRAEAVAAELVKAGVARSAISISAFGSTKPLVATGPQVREPQNRRVEIVLK